MSWLRKNLGGFNSRVKAGALQLTLHIVIVIGLLLTAFILLVYLHKRFRLQTTFVKETVENCDRGINYSLKNRLVSNTSTPIPLNDEDYKSLSVEKTFWGAFEKITVESKVKTNQFKKVALIGASQLDINRPSLYLEETKTPLVLVGQTRLEGLNYLPAQGVKPGYISGESYSGSQLIYGASKKIQSFPKPSSEWLNYITTVSSYKDTGNFIEIEAGQSYTNSFKEPMQVIYRSGKLNLNFVELTGNIVVQSETEIVVSASTRLKDVLLIAPKITIVDNVKGAFQAIANKSIAVGKNVNLSYPSSLIVEETRISHIENSVQKKNIPIEIGNNTTISGQMIFFGQTKANNYDSQIYISEDVTINGEVYCNQNIELLGTVRGTVFAHNFIVHKGGSIYQNHLYGAKISVDALPQKYVGMLINDSEKAVAKWLY
ncbi:hypothetical protein DFQ05_2216 [Winogradskyella wandonensis]|uniref:Uncharacterized protein n=1 Tax=Winogradskyella wandonensis TaxID=1442586 RepID=A0A4R1KJS6_9FLAO|nr:hypothetical protein [Winogradskyella wandonensis]TCK65004.1 hypothetical protein DFQ05_2216 [Winogradskyella wandonensis]